jgi:hypothetical protein
VALVREEALNASFAVLLNGCVNNGKIKHSHQVGGFLIDGFEYYIDDKCLQSSSSNTSFGICGNWRGSHLELEATEAIVE